MLKVKEEEEENPPLMATYKHLLDGPEQQRLRLDNNDDDEDGQVLPVIDLHDDEHCRAAMVHAASEWGFFQVTNHGVPQPLLDELHEAQVAVFRRPFQCKLREPLQGLESSPESYRWGTPTATCLEQLSWSEAYHIPMTTTSDGAADTKTSRLRLVVEEVSAAMSKLAMQLAGILVAGLDNEEEDTAVVGCTRDTCFLRLNRYPAAPASGGAKAARFGLCAHTDSDFVTILHQQDAVGGLQVLKDKEAGRWVAVRPNPGALIVNVGDLLQAWSNDRYRSIQHRVVVPAAAAERFSVAFFLCPADDRLIRPRCTTSGGDDTPRYRSFTFGEYRNQVREDVRLTGRKLGLQRFRIEGSSSCGPL
ncbi:unnamed protein product [Urochloa decumbens]|uniref:Fe2OG dioxygenase domain-containing protein n=1 Tax=Urochloa decumbens TaxID=240449 RepID=A0ABC9FLZ7_9POAL